MYCHVTCYNFHNARSNQSTVKVQSCNDHHEVQLIKFVMLNLGAQEPAGKMNLYLIGYELITEAVNARSNQSTVKVQSCNDNHEVQLIKFVMLN